MFKVLLVDDEKIFLNFMSKAVDWSAENCEIINMVGDGEHAIEIIKHKKPDIVFLDINMPGINGLQVCELLKNLKINCKVIITTAHNEFNFAQQAIKLNVFDYLLKPFDKGELLNTLNRCKMRIEKETVVDKRNQHLQTTAGLQLILEYGVDEKKIVNIAKYDGLLNNFYFLPVIIKAINNTALAFEDVSALLIRHINIGCSESYILGYQGHGTVVIHQFETSCDLKLIMFHYNNLLSDKLAKKIQNICFGKSVQGLSNLQDGYRKAVVVAENSIKFSNIILTYDMIAHNEEQESSYTVQDIVDIIKIVEIKDDEQLDLIIAKTFGLQNSQTISFSYIISVYYAVVTGMFAHYNVIEDRKLNSYTEIAKSLLQDIIDCSNRKQIISVVNNYIYEVFSDFTKLQSVSKKDILIAKIDEYLNANYQNSELSVNKIAEDMFFENSYIRRVYKSISGKTIMNKLEEIRIGKAKKLLTDSRNKNADIAAMCGFADQYYFSKRFKLITGKTPLEYRQSH